MVAMNFVFSSVVTYMVSILCAIVLQFIIFGIVYLINEIIGSDFHYGIIKKQIFIRVLKYNILMVTFATLFWLFYKFISLGYI